MNSQVPLGTWLFVEFSEKVKNRLPNGWVVGHRSAGHAGLTRTDHTGSAGQEGTAMTKISIGLFAAIVAATVGLPVEAHAQAQSDGVCPQATVDMLEARVAAAPDGSPEERAAQARLTDCRLRAAQQRLASCQATSEVLWTRLDECLGVTPPRVITDTECERSCTSRGGRWENGACECLPDFHHPRPGRRLPAATAACLCVPDRRPPPRPAPGGGGGGGGGGTPTPTAVRRCPPGARNIRGEDVSGHPVPANDRDCDGWNDANDNAPDFNNPQQRDWDLDGRGDCDRDGDDVSDCRPEDGCDSGTDDGDESFCDAFMNDICSDTDLGRDRRAVCIAIARIEARLAQPGDREVTVEFEEMLCERPQDRDRPICRRLRNLEDRVDDHEERISLLERFGNPLRLTLGVGTYTLSPTLQLEAQFGIRLHERVSLRFHGHAGLDVFGNGDGSYSSGGGGGFEFTLFANSDFALYLATGVLGIHAASLQDGDLGVLNFFGGFLDISATIGRATGARRRGFHFGARIMGGRSETDIRPPNTQFEFVGFVGWHIL